jgi:hypothetical protein
MSTFRGLLALMLAVVSGTVARAQDPKPALAPAIAVADVRCLIVALQMGSTPGAEAQTAAFMSVMYYFGKLDKGVRDAELEQAIAQEALKMTQGEVATEARRCGSELQERGKAITTIGNDLVARGPALYPKPPVGASPSTASSR